MKILVIQKKRIGDVLTTTVVFDVLRDVYPDATLHYLVYPFCVPVVAHHPSIDRLVVFDPQAKPKLWHYLRILWQLRREQYDIVIDAYSKPNSLLMAWLSSAKRIISFDKPKYRWLTTDPVVRQTEHFSVGTSAIDHRMQLLEPLGIQRQLRAPRIVLTATELAVAQKRWATYLNPPDSPVWMISAIGSRDFKTYPLPYMAQLIDDLAQRAPGIILLNYEPHQKDQALQLKALCAPATQSRIAFEVYESDLRGFLALLGGCTALLGNEGGATNMAKAVGIPTFSIFSPDVDKNAWNMFEDGQWHDSVSWEEVVPVESQKAVSGGERYLEMRPEYLLPRWRAFIQRHQHRHRTIT